MIRFRGALRTAIRLSGVSNREIERRLRLSNGYLTRLLNGQIELRVALVLNVCRVIGLPVGAFFKALYPTEAASPLTRGLAQLHPGAGQGVGGAAGLVRQIRAVLDDFETAGEV